MPVRRPLPDAGTLCSRMRYPASVISAKPIGTIPWSTRTVGPSIGFSSCCQSSLPFSLDGPPYFRSTASQLPLKTPHSVSHDWWPSG